MATVKRVMGSLPMAGMVGREAGCGQRAVSLDERPGREYSWSLNVQRRHHAGEGSAMPQFVCPLCARPLSEGPSLLFQGDVLVHAACWSPVRKPLSTAGEASAVTEQSRSVPAS